MSGSRPNGEVGLRTPIGRVTVPGREGHVRVDCAEESLPRGGFCELAFDPRFDALTSQIPEEIRPHLTGLTGAVYRPTSRSVHPTSPNSRSPTIFGFRTSMASLINCSFVMFVMAPSLRVDSTQVRSCFAQPQIRTFRSCSFLR